MKKDFNKLLIERILGNIPSHIKLVPYLMQKLNLGQESVYRRLRNEVPFTFAEVIILSAEFGFSVDEIIGSVNDNYSFLKVKKDTLSNAKDTFLNILNIFHDVALRMVEAKKTTLQATGNNVRVTDLLNYEYLFRFYYFKWVHQTYGIPPDFIFSKMVIPPEIITLKNKTSNLMKQVKNIEYILIVDQYVFLNIVKEVQYYYKLKLLSDEEISLISQDIHKHINLCGSLVQENLDDYGIKYNMYVSILNIESNTSCITCDDKPQAFFSIYPICRTYSFDQKIAEMLLKWYESMKKCSTLITQSNEYLRVNFFRKQHEYVDRIKDYKLYPFLDE